MELKELKISEILVDEDFNCRGLITPIDVVDMAKDIERQGLIQPITVCPIEPINGKKYRLLAGFRRTKAHIVLKRETIPAVIKEQTATEAEARIINLAENLHRKNLNVLQEARAMRHLFVFGMSETDIAVKLGQSRGWVQIRAMLLKLPDEVQKEVEAGMIGHVNIRELYMIHKHGNIENLYRAVRDIKDQKLRGKKAITVNMNIIGEKAKTNLYRTKSEIEKMTIKLVEKGLKGIHTRALAWAAGNITMEIFLTDIAAYADNEGIQYVQLTDKEVSDICER